MKKEIKEILEKYKKHTDEKFDKIDKKVDEKVDELKRHFEVVREDFDEKVGLITEQYGAIMEKLGNHEQRLTSIEKNMEIVKVDIVFIKNGLKKKVDVEEFSALENRVAILEARVGKMIK